jgi:hypothetical protein
MEEALEKCNICDSEIDEDNGDVVGEFGICPVAFCVWCMSSMTDMVVQINGFNDIGVLQERISELREEQKDESYYNALKKMYKDTKERIRQVKKEKNDTPKQTKR